MQGDTLSILISCCMQDQFIGDTASAASPAPESDLPPHRHDTAASTVPSALHIGPVETHRLLGSDSSNLSSTGTGPMGRLLSWTRQRQQQQHTADRVPLEVVHIRAVPDKSRTDGGFFGPFLPPNAAGAVDSNTDQSHVVHTHGLNIAEQSDLLPVLRGIIDKYEKSRTRGYNDVCSKPLNVQIGVVGLWTDSTVFFLCYELSTRLRIPHIATCSVLTASTSRAQHFNALEQMKSLLGVQVLDSLVQFCRWMATRRGTTEEQGEEVEIPLPYDSNNDNSQCHNITLIALDEKEYDNVTSSSHSPPTMLSDLDRSIVRFLYKDSTSVRLKHLSTGHSGALVFRAFSKDTLGHEQMTTVLKISTVDKVATERVASEQMQDVLGNHAPQIRGYVEFKNRAGIKFSYASMGEGPTRSFAAVYRDRHTSQEHINRILHDTFDNVLRRFYQAASLEQVNLFDEYDFDGVGWSYAAGGSDRPSTVKKFIVDILGENCDSNREHLYIGGMKLPNVALFLERSIPLLRESYISRSFHHVSFVHGDLNAGNILTDSNDNIFLVDFEYMSRTHILKDIAKIESDILFDLTILDDEEELKEAARINTAQIRVRDLREDFVDGTVEQKDNDHGGRKLDGKFKRMWDTVAFCRSIASKLVKQDRNPTQMNIVLLRYALHIVSMSRKPRLNRTWALMAACMYADQIERERHQHALLFVDWIPLQDHYIDRRRVDETYNKERQTGRSIAGKLGVTMLPGRIDRGADAVVDTQRLKESGVTRMVLVCTQQELEQLTTDKKVATRATENGIEVQWMPIAVHNVPTLKRAKQIAEWIKEQVLAGESVVIVSHAGLRRAGTLACTSLMEISARTRGMSQRMLPEEAIELVKDARSPRAVDHPMQFNFLRTYYEWMAKSGKDVEADEKQF